ncbi:MULTISPECIES: hypothetical protein [unclassified Cyanobium]|uniref:hypothetical protein n=1 Tax=unclassified Cyanobium TaxID=2627006 RepID=UPI0020CC92B9|nr:MULTISPECIES: hypothetical protein [unclassified Cyanobium]MCP9859114.1 hypothetical protein [Cyanobium sp. Cruz-8H5]MCP9866282.1 hypothetical protein [Cyanobium sp. Cruz-8D1]
MLEPLLDDFEDEVTRWNAMYEVDKPNARYIGEIFQVSSCSELRAILEPQNIRFAYPGETANPFDAFRHLCFTFLSDYTCNRVGDVDRPLDGLAPLTDAARCHREHGLEGKILGIEHLANLPMSTEDFVRNFGRRTHHIAYEVADGERNGEKNVDVVVRTLRDLGIPFLADMVGEGGDEPNLRQIFSRSSAYSLLITEYVERCLGYDGFFTRENVAALTEAAGHAERYEHGHVFD